MHLESLNSKFKTIIKFLRQIFIELKVTIICIVRTKIKQKYAKKRSCFGFLFGVATYKICAFLYIIGFVLMSTVECTTLY